MHRVAVVVAALILAAALPALAADESAEVKALKEQVRSLQDANVVMKEGLAQAHLRLAQLEAQQRAQTEALQQQVADLGKQIEELRQMLAAERAAHQAALAQEQAQKEQALAEAARLRARTRDQRFWLYIAGAAAAILAATR